MALTRKWEAELEHSVPELNEAVEPPSTVDAEEDVVAASVPELNEDVVGEPPSTVGAEEDEDGLVVLENHHFFWLRTSLHL